jgi:integrase
MHGHQPEMTDAVGRVIVLPEANSGLPLKGDFERMARRRYQDPKPKRRGAWWTLLVWEDNFTGGQHTRKRKRIRLAPATMPEREVRKVASEHLRPINQGLESIGSATNFAHYVETTYKPTILPLMATSTQNRCEGVIKNYLLPTFGSKCLRELTPMSLQAYFSAMTSSPLSHESKDKIRDVLSGVLRSAVTYGLLVRNPAENVKLPPEKRGRKRNKPYVTPEQFDALLELIVEPYATMLYVAVYTGLRVSELAGLKWNDLIVVEHVNEHGDKSNRYALSVDERFCRGDWGAPKSDASNATIGINECVYRRIQRLKLLTVSVKAGLALRRYRVVKLEGPEDLVFQGLRSGKPMRDNNILSRHIKPAARKLGLDFVNWRCLRTSHATWLKLAGADVKDAQAQMRHSRASTTLDIYQQFVPESQQKIVEKLSSLSKLVQ